MNAALEALARVRRERAWLNANDPERSARRLARLELLADVAEATTPSTTVEVPTFFKPESDGISLSRARRIVRKRSGGRCEAAIDGVCTGKAQHVHHVRWRNRGHDPAHLLHVCHPCHDHIHGNTKVARERGWLDR